MKAMKFFTVIALAMMSVSQSPLVTTTTMFIGIIRLIPTRLLR